MWEYVDLGDVGERLCARPEISQIAAARSPDECLYVLVVPQGLVYGTVLRDIVLDELGEAEHDVAVAVVRELSGRESISSVDQEQIVALAEQVVGDRRWVYPMVPPRTDQEKAVAALLGELLDVHRLSVTDNLQMLGVDSLVLVELSVAIKERFGVTLRAMDLFEVDTVAELVTLIQDQTSGVTP